MEKGIKKCPYCGGSAYIQVRQDTPNGLEIWCECERCKRKTTSYHTDSAKCAELARAEWNRGRAERVVDEKQVDAEAVVRDLFNMGDRITLKVNGCQILEDGRMILFCRWV